MNLKALSLKWALAFAGAVVVGGGMTDTRYVGCLKFFADPLDKSSGDAVHLSAVLGCT